MWFPWAWTQLERADIPLETRAKFEHMGITVISQALSRDLLIPGAGVLIFESARYSTSASRASTENDYAWAWLREQISREERRRDIGEFVEIAILVLVAIEAVPVLLKAVIECWRLV